MCLHVMKAYTSSGSTKLLTMDFGIRQYQPGLTVTCTRTPRGSKTHLSFKATMKVLKILEAYGGVDQRSLHSVMHMAYEKKLWKNRRELK